MSQCQNFMKSSIVIAAVFAASQAHAQNVLSSQTTLSDVSITITDLKPEDGLAGEINLFDKSQTLKVELYSNNYLVKPDSIDPVVIESKNLAEGFLGNISANYIAAIDSPETYATRYANAIATSASMDLERIKQNISGPYIQTDPGFENLIYGAYASVRPLDLPLDIFGDSFFISPNTLITISGKLQTDIQIDANSILLADVKNQVGAADASMSFAVDSNAYIYFKDIDQNFIDEAYLNNSATFLMLANGDTEWYGLHIVQDLFSETKSFSITFSNTSDEQKFVEFGYHVYSQSNVSVIDSASAIPAIPEPSTYALMVLGIVGIGAVARRSRPATLA